MPYDHSASRPISQTAFERLKKSANAVPRLAVAGEFSSGKSSLLNLLLGEQILPTRTTATALPSVWISYGDKEGHYMDAEGNRYALPEGGIEAVPSDSRFIRLYKTAEFLKGCEIIDLAGLADPERPDSTTHEMLSYANMAIWCTSATQAWRQSERAAWLTVPPRIRANSILAITRSDKLTNDQDRHRVMNRVKHETVGLFSEYVPISAYLAMQAVVNDDEEAWRDSGMDELVDILSAQTDLIRDARCSLLERYVPGHTLAEGPAGEAEDTDDDLIVQPDVSDNELRHDLIAFPSRHNSEVKYTLQPSPGTESRLEPLLLVSNLSEIPVDAEREVYPITEAALSAEDEPGDADLEEFAILREVCADEVAEASTEPLGPMQAEGAAAQVDARLIPGIEAAMERVLSRCLAKTQDAGTPMQLQAFPSSRVSELPPGNLPREARIWREIVAETPVPAEQLAVIGMIEELLVRLRA